LLQVETPVEFLSCTGYRVKLRIYDINDLLNEYFNAIANYNKRSFYLVTE